MVAGLVYLFFPIVFQFLFDYHFLSIADVYTVLRPAYALSVEVVPDILLLAVFRSINILDACRLTIVEDKCHLGTCRQGPELGIRLVDRKTVDRSLCGTYRPA